MNARHILSRWERVKPVLDASPLCEPGRPAPLRPVMLWMAMLYAARGNASAPALHEDLGCSLTSASAIIRAMAAHGLIVESGKKVEYSRPRQLWTATPKLLSILQLEAIPNAKETA